MSHPRALYATPAQAEADLHGLALTVHHAVVPRSVILVVRAVVANPAASSDSLLILADALRECGEHDIDVPRWRALNQIADDLATLAPTRACRIESPAT